MGRLTPDWSYIDRQEMAFEHTRCMKIQGSWLWYWSLSGGCKFRERLAVSKQATQKFDRERFNLRKLNELEVRKQYHIQITNRFAALEIWSDNEDINRALENIKENMNSSAKDSLGLHELKQHNPWFDEELYN